jgi:serine/threonine protein phosphatase 1
MSALGFKSTRRAKTPDGVRIYAVGDIHGCAAALDALHARIADDAASHAGDTQIVYLGDYIDRGPDSRGIVERMLHAVPKGLSARYIKGNHDAALLAFLEDAQIYRMWRGFGAPQTLLSYGVRPPLFDSFDAFETARRSLAAALPADHLQFFRSLKLKFVSGGYAFVHAGIRPGLDLESQSEADLLRIRDAFLSCTAAFDKVVVHGHTPVPGPVRLHNRIAVDTGVYATGILTCAVLEGESCRFIQVGNGKAEEQAGLFRA